MTLTTGQRSKGLASPLCKGAGFTLIELALVAVIIAILLSISTPVFRRTYRDLQLREASYNISKFINYSRTMSITERINTRLNFDFELGKYWLTVSGNPEDPDAFERIAGRLGRFYSVPSGLKLRGEDKDLDFYPNGRSEAFKIFLENRNGKGNIIEVEAATGEAKIREAEE